MGSVDLQLSMSCAACGVVVPINAFVGEAQCWSCERRTPLDVTTWKLLLDAPLGAAAEVSAGVEQAATLHSEAGTFHRVFRGGAAMCNACRAPVSGDDLRALALRGGQSSTAHCPQCKEQIFLRPAPPMLAAAGVAALAGETDARRVRAPRALSCTTCGGELSVDGSSRVVTCGYCRGTQYLPNELFLSLKSLPVRQWSLLLSEAVVQRVTTTLADWSALYDVVADAQGNLYAWGFGKQDQAAAQAAIREAVKQGRGLDSASVSTLWCMSPDLTIRWKREGLGLHNWATRLARTPTNHVLVWDGGSAQVMQGSDGATVYRYGGRASEGGALQTQGATSLQVDADGSLLLLADDGQLLRYDWSGQPIATWGSGARATSKRAEVWVRELSHKPLQVYKGTLGVGWDGRLYVQSSILYDDACHVASFNRDGKRQHLAECPIGPSTLLEQRPAIDAQGAVYIIADHVFTGGSECSIYRIEPDGKHTKEWIARGSRGGQLGKETLIAAAQDGSLFALGNNGLLRRFGADGRLQFMSPAAAAAAG